MSREDRLEQFNERRLAMDMTLRKADKSEITFLQDFAKDVINANYRVFLGDEAVDFSLEAEPRMRMWRRI